MKFSTLRTDTEVENPELFKKITEAKSKIRIKRNFVDSFIYLFTIYSDYKGRTGRKDYFSFIIIFSFFLFLLKQIDIGSIINIPLMIYMIIFFLPLFSNTIRRLHDSNHSGWLIFVPLYDIYLLFIRGNEEDNKYGPSPLFE